VFITLVVNSSQIPSVRFEPQGIRGGAACEICKNAHEYIHNEINSVFILQVPLLKECALYYPKVKTICGLIIEEWFDAIADSTYNSTRTCRRLKFCRKSQRRSNFSIADRFNLGSQSNPPFSRWIHKDFQEIRNDISCGICNLMFDDILERQKT
jgi:hypothetical protein